VRRHQGGGQADGESTSNLVRWLPRSSCLRFDIVAVLLLLALVPVLVLLPNQVKWR
jgi:hypothetical protein